MLWWLNGGLRRKVAAVRRLRGLLICALQYEADRAAAVESLRLDLPGLRRRADDWQRCLRAARRAREPELAAVARRWLDAAREELCHVEAYVGASVDDELLQSEVLAYKQLLSGLEARGVPVGRLSLPSIVPDLGAAEVRAARCELELADESEAWDRRLFEGGSGIKLSMRETAPPELGDAGRGAGS